MRHPILLTLTLAVLTASTFSFPAHAQEDAELENRLDRMERDMNFLQKQVYRGASADASSGAAPTNGGQLEVQISQINEQMRQLRGQIEQVQFANRQNATDLKKLSDDMEYRLHAIEEKQVPASAPVAAARPVASSTATTQDLTNEQPAQFDPNAKPDSKAEAKAAAVAAAATAAAQKPALTGNDFPDANAHYSYAFKLLNEKKYSEAATSFDAFVKKYPSDPLTANAYYWLGESYFARADYTRSAESFRKGFEANPSGQKAPDNLYRLAKSLAQVKRTNEACIVLSQVIKKYPDTAPRIVQKASDERIAMQCK